MRQLLKPRINKHEKLTHIHFNNLNIHIDFPEVLEPFWCLGGVLGALGGHLKPSRGRLRASWMRVGGYLEPSWAILGHLGGHLGLSEALLEPSWAILGAPTARGAPRPGPGEGVKG